MPYLRVSVLVSENDFTRDAEILRKHDPSIGQKGRAPAPVDYCRWKKGKDVGRNRKDKNVGIVRAHRNGSE